MADNTLLLTVGLPRSGKTTWARTQNLPIVSPDAIRLALHGQPYISAAEPTVWAAAKLHVNALFRYGYPVVLVDACNISVAAREEWYSRKWRRVAVLFSADEATCVERAKASGTEYLIDTIKRMAGRYQRPAEIKHITPEADWQSVIDTVTDSQACRYVGG